MTFSDLTQAALRSHREGRLSDAGAQLRRVLELEPEHAEAHYYLGLLERDAGAASRALACFERAVALRPTEARLQHQLGTALFDACAVERGEQHLRVAVALEPHAALLRLDLALVLDSRQAHGEAAEQYEACLRLEPGNVVALNNLSLALYFLNRLDESLAVLERASRLYPSLPRLHVNRGNALRGSGRVEEAVESYRRALQLDPSDDKAHSNLLYSLPFVPGLGDAEIAKEARDWERRHAAFVPPLSRLEPRPRSTARRLRVGYVSADFHEHVQALFVLPLLRHHDRDTIEVYCYSTASRVDSFTEDHRALADTFRDLTRLSDEQAARVIRDDEIDVLVDLTLHMASARLRIFASKPAPVQVTWLGYPGTTGLSAIDYRFSDPHLEPPELAMPSAERPWRLPDTFWCYRPWFRPDEREIEPGPLPASSREGITFGCCNNLSKLNDGVLARWASVLCAVDRSRLLVLSPEGQARERISAFFERAGVARARVQFTGPAAHARYLRTYQAIDISLDTLPYNGHTTSLDSWWMGVPVLSLVGGTLVGRAGRCFANNLGLPEWAVDSEQDFIEAARGFSSDLRALASLRADLRSRVEASPLMDAVRFARNLEAAYREMWTRAQEQPPRTDPASRARPEAIAQVSS